MASEIRSNKIYNSTGTGTPETVTPLPGDVSKKIATTEFVKNELDSFTSVEINDTTPAVDKVYSSQKVELLVGTKQDTLESGTDIKTINGETILGSGDIVISNSMVYLGTFTAAASATLDIEGVFSSDYDYYTIIGTDLVPSVTSSNMSMKMKINDAYLDAGYQYHIAQLSSSTAAYSAMISNTAVKVERILYQVGNTANANGSFFMEVFSPNTGLIKNISFRSSANDNSTLRMSHGSITNTTAGILSGLRFYFESANITSGNIRVYGLKKV